MLWFLLALMSAIFRSFANVIHRFVLKDFDYVSYAFIFQIITAILFLPLFLIEFSLPYVPYAWFLAFLSSAFWIAISLLGFKSYQHTEVSLRGPISETRILFVLLLSVIILVEAITLNKIFGILLAFAGLVILTWEGGLRFAKFSDVGVQLTLLTAIFGAFVAIVDKAAMSYWTPSVYGFIQYLVPGIFIGIMLKNKKRRSTKIMNGKKFFIVVAAVLGVAFYYLELKALSLADVSLVFPIIRLSTLFTVLGGMIILRERKEIGRRLFAAAIMIISTLMIAGYLKIF